VKEAGNIISNKELPSLFRESTCEGVTWSSGRRITIFPLYSSVKSEEVDCQRSKGFVEVLKCGLLVG
jgi:hypothetical protein